MGLLLRHAALALLLSSEAASTSASFASSSTSLVGGCGSAFHRGSPSRGGGGGGGFCATELRVATPNRPRGTQQQRQRQRQRSHIAPQPRAREKFGEYGTESSILDVGLDGSLPSEEAAARRRLEAQRTVGSIIDDGYGHINPQLAQSIWEWENEHLIQEQRRQRRRQQSKGEGEGEADDAPGADDADEADESGGGSGGERSFPAARLKFSTRAGLRIVDEIAREMLALSSDPASASASARNEARRTAGRPARAIRGEATDGGADSAAAGGGASVSYSDLCQEGTIALMRAIAKYDPAMPDTFETYARRKIVRALSRAAADTARPLRLPSRVHAILRSARREATELRGAQVDREPTLTEIAAKVGVPPETLRFYGLVGRNAVPVEGTVEIYDPDSPTGESLAFADEDAYESVTGKDEALLHSGEADILEEEDGWVEPHDKIVAPLRDAIVDARAQSPDEEVMEDIMRSDIDDLLVRTLDERELAVIRMRFGLATPPDPSSSTAATDSTSEDTSGGGGGGGGRSDHPVYREGMTFTEIGSHLGISRQRAAQIEQCALERLRDSYSSVFVEQYLDDDHSAEVSL